MTFKGTVMGARDTGLMKTASGKEYRIAEVFVSEPAGRERLNGEPVIRLDRETMRACADVNNLIGQVHEFFIIDLGYDSYNEKPYMIGRLKTGQSNTK